MKFTPTFFYVSALLVLFTACSKGNSTTEEEPGICRIIAATLVNGSGTTNYALTYDENGRVNSILTTSGGVSTQKQFAFTGNVTKITHTQGGQTIQVDSLVNNANGLIGYIRTRYPTSTNINETVMTYNGTEIATFQAFNNGVPGDLFTAGFMNGNLVTWTGPGIVQTNTFDANKAAQPGDDLYFRQLVNHGNPYFRNKNLLTSVNVNSNSQPVTYTFDTDGKIRTARSSNPTNVQTTTYVYSCD